MTLPEIARRRLMNQQLAGTTLQTAPEMVAWLGAVQAQEYAHSRWSLGLRLPHLDDTAIERDIDEGKIIRIHLLRPTWHFIAAEDLRWMLQLSASRVHAANAYMYRKLELDAAVFNTCRDVLISMLEGGQHLTRNLLNDGFRKNGIIADGHRLSYIMLHNELEGVVCNGARQGNQFTYALVEERVAKQPEKSLDEALFELSRRYISSKGPATVKDFATWSGLTMTDCKKGISMLGDQVASVKVDGTDYYYNPAMPFENRSFPEMMLLPIYDEFIMGYKDRNAILEVRNSFASQPFLPFDCTILQDGQIIGSWKRTFVKHGTDLKYDLFQPLDAAQTPLLEKAIRRFEEFTHSNVLKS